jgi:predicted nucleic acid-binding protein
MRGKRRICYRLLACKLKAGNSTRRKQMSDRVFLDANILVYLYSEDEGNKRDIAYKIVNDSLCIISTQTLNEASNVWYKKYKLNKAHIIKYLDEIESVCDQILLIQRKTINQALIIKDRYGCSYYDSLMLASALEGNCKIIFTEDLQDGQLIEDTLRIVNPYKDV